MEVSTIVKNDVNDVYSFGVTLVEHLIGKRPLSKERKTLTSIFNITR